MRIIISFFKTNTKMNCIPIRKPKKSKVYPLSVENITNPDVLENLGTEPTMIRHIKIRDENFSRQNTVFTFENKTK